MKTTLSVSVILSCLLLSLGGVQLRAADEPSQQLSMLVNYADQLQSQGVKGQLLADKVNQRANELAIQFGKPELRGIGTYVLQQQAQGLHGTALVSAVHNELIRRNIGNGNAQPGGPQASPGTTNPGMVNPGTVNPGTTNPGTINPGTTPGSGTVPGSNQMENHSGTAPQGNTGK